MERVLRYLFITAILLGVSLSVVVVYFPGAMVDNTDSERRIAPDKSDDNLSGEPEQELRLDDEPVSVSSTSMPETVEPEQAWFDEVGTEVGLTYFDIREYLRNRTSPPPQEGDGSAVYVSDYDVDGFPDMLAVLNGTPVLYHNSGGYYNKTDALPAVGTYVTAAHFFDYDNDGWDDLYLLSDEESVFFENDGGKFVERDVGLNIEYDSVRGTATADYTGNGCLDVFVVQANDWMEHSPEGYNDRNVTIEEDNGNKNRLFRGNCSSFEETTEEAGIHGEAWSLATSFVDLTNDGYPDIHVANDFNNDVVYINQRNGTFDRNVLPNFTNRNGMSSEVADVNGDGYLDIFVSNIHHEGVPGTKYRYGGRVDGNNLLLNQGNGTFADVADSYEVKRGGYGWAAIIEDFDGDGHLDLYQSNSMVWGERYPNFWRGTTNGFERMNSSKMGFGISEHLGAAFLDYDRDGMLEIGTSDITGRARFYDNRLDTDSWLTVRLVGSSNHTTLGTRVEVIANAQKQMRVQTSGSDYFSQDSRLLHFGLNGTEVVDEIRVEWSDGEVQTYTDVRTGQHLTIDRNGELRGTVPR